MMGVVGHNCWSGMLGRLLGFWFVLAGPTSQAVEVNLQLSSDAASNRVIVADALADAEAYFAGSPTGNYTINFPAGTWTIHHPNDHGMHIDSFNTSASNRLIICGAGKEDTVIQFDQFDQFGFFIEETPFITVEDMHFSRCRSTDSENEPEDIGLYCAQGTVVSVTNGLIEFESHTGFPNPEWLMEKAGPDQERTFMAFTHENALNPKMAPKAVRIFLSGITNVTGNTYLASLEDANEMPDLEAGDWIALKTKCGLTTLRTHNCDDFVIEDVLFTRSASCSLMLLRGSDHAEVRRVTIARPDPINGKGHCYSSPAGGPQIYADTHGPVVEDCEIIATADDGIAVFTYKPEVVGYVMTNSVIRNNLVRDTHGRGIVVAFASDGVISNNVIERARAWELLFAVDERGNSNTTIKCENWLATDNTFIQPWGFSAIGFHMTAIDGGRNDEIYIENNTFIEAAKNNAVIDVDFTDHIYINNNTVLSFSDEEDVGSPNTIPEPVPALVYVYDGLNVTGTNNYCAEATSKLATLANAANTGAVDVEWLGSDIVGGGGVRVAIADAHVIENAASNNYGDDADLDVRSTPGVARKRYSYLKFNVNEANLPIESATLRIYSEDVDTDVSAYAVADSSWNEDTITWNNKPALGSLLDTQAVTTNQWIEFDVSDHIISNGMFTVALAGASATEDPVGYNFLSRETMQIPHIVLECSSVVATARFYSVSSEDGYIVETGENTGVGDRVTADSDGTRALRVGDTLNKKQWLSVVSFDTSSLESAKILSANLELRRGMQVGDPSGFGDLLVDQKGDDGFSDDFALEPSDFEAVADVEEVATLNYPTADGDVASGELSQMGLSYISRQSNTQFRIRFETGSDGDSGNDYLGFWSGEASEETNRPMLEVIYEL